MNMFKIRGVHCPQGRTKLKKAVQNYLGPLDPSIPIQFIEPEEETERRNDSVFVWITDIPKGTNALQIMELVNQSFHAAGVGSPGIDIE